MSEIKTLGSYFGLLCVWLPNFTDTCASCSTLLRLEQFPFGRAKATLLGFVRGRELRVWGLGVYQCVHSNLKLKRKKKTYNDTSYSQVCSRTDTQPPEYNAGKAVSLVVSLFRVFRRVNQSE